MTAPAPQSQPSTATPWNVTRDERGSIVRAADKRPIASMWENGDDPKANAAFIVAAVNSHASLTARVSELESELADYKQAVRVEADLLREFAGRLGNLVHPFRAVDDRDWFHLLSFIPDSGHGKFWKAVFAELKPSLPQFSGLARTAGDGK